MAEYPPPKPTSRRRGNLGRAWYVEVTETPDEVSAKVGNNMYYGPFVQSEAFQAWMHQDYWQTDQMAVDQLRPAIEQDFQNTIRELFK